MRCSSSKTQALLDEFVDGTLADADHARVEAHVATCDDCASLLEELRVVDALLVAPRVLEPAANFTFAVMADVRTMRAPHPHHRISFAALGTYIVFAWLAIGAFLFFGGHAARAALASLGALGGVAIHGSAILARAGGHVFGAHTLDITAAMGAVLGFDLVAAAAVYVAFNYVRSRRASLERGFE
jgi:anti-sigma factor RsiW